MSPALSDTLGWMSILCWLGAQFPQVIENYKNQSVEGLALPFLLNWLLGDITNLVGCLLTHQLPFQTYVAIYFVFVDASLLSQYFYYRRRAAAALIAASASTPTSASAFRASHLSRASSTFRRTHSHYRSLSNVAANVAAAAALAAHEQESEYEREQGRSSLSRTRGPPSASLSPINNHPSAHRFWEGAPASHDGHDADAAVAFADDEADGEGEPDDAALTRMMASFRSEGGGGRSARRTHAHGGGLKVSWGEDSETARTLRTHASTQFAEYFAARGRAAHRSLDADGNDAEVLGEDGARAENGDGNGPGSSSLSRPSSRVRRSSAAGRRGAGMVFLGVWALAGMGSFATSRRMLGSRKANADVALGSVLARVDVPPVYASSSPPVDWSYPPPPDAPAHAHAHAHADAHVASDDAPDGWPSMSSERPMRSQRKKEEPSMEFVIGRISAWVCTTLYLTSRLPQIWKNFVRKSVEGLSMALFVFAFLGNTFYVASILASPALDPVLHTAPERASFLRETLPYLLGSGGTLVFDVTIVVQSCVYRRRRRAGHLAAGAQGKAKGRRGASAVRKDGAEGDGDEEEGLLARGESAERGAGRDADADVEENMSASWVSNRSARRAGQSASPSRTVRPSD